MRRVEVVYRELLTAFLDGDERFTQKALGKKLGFSLSTVNGALEPLASMNAIQKKPRGFVLVDFRKTLLYWASVRKLEKDIVYQTRVEAGMNEIEKSLPPCTFTAYSAYKILFKETPSDYGEVISYADPTIIEKRFPKRPGVPNLIVLEPAYVSGKAVTLPQLFVDLWNLKSWYASEFVKALEEKINGILERRGH
ncbi:hypothetical protein HY546_00840 [archaeon]|nr:hypothetical protein [archaeon]